MIKIMRYLKGTQDLGPVLDKGEGAPSGKVVLDVFADTSYDHDDASKKAMTCGAHWSSVTESARSKMRTLFSFLTRVEL